MAVVRESDRERKIRIWAIVIISIAAILAVAMFITQMTGTEGQIMEREGYKIITLHPETLLIYISAIVALVAYVISWRHKLTAGIMFILAGISWIILDLLPDAYVTPEFVASRHAGLEASGGPVFIFGIPFLVAGVLFLWYVWSYRRRARQES